MPIAQHEQSTLLITGLSGYVGQGLARHPALARFGRVVGTYFQHPVSLPGHATCRLDLTCLLYTSPSPRDRTRSRMPSSA